MGDLISKSELLESLNDWIDENTDIKTILRWIEEYEVAYNVEKVIEEIEDSIEEPMLRPSDIVWNNAINMCLEVVRNGGKE